MSPWLTPVCGCDDLAAYLPLLLGNTIFADENILIYPVKSEAGNNLPTWQLLPDPENWEVVEKGAAFRLKESGYLFVYADQAGLVYLKFATDNRPKPTQLTWRLNDTLAKTYLIEAASHYPTVLLSLRGGLNYTRLSTEPDRDLEFLEITV